MNESKPITVSVVLANRQYTDFFRSADMFERFKCVASLEPWTISVSALKPGVVIEHSLAVLVKTLQDHKETWPVALWSHGPEYLWHDSVIKSISTGKQWCLLSDYLKFLGVDKFPELVVGTEKDGGFRWDHKPAKG